MKIDQWGEIDRLVYAPILNLKFPSVQWFNDNYLYTKNYKNTNSKEV